LVLLLLICVEHPPTATFSVRGGDSPRVSLAGADLDDEVDLAVVPRTNPDHHAVGEAVLPTTR
jgi:hypothetical protein